MKHIWWSCSCHQRQCEYCEFGFDPPEQCTVCGASYGELLPSCPGFELNQEAKEFCYNGHVLSIESAKKYRANGLPYPFPGKGGREKLSKKDKRFYGTFIFPWNMARVIKFRGRKD